MSLKISVLAIGTELLSGELSDTNTACIARILGADGYELRESLTVADVESDIEEALLHLVSRRDIVLVTGGLGPTADDLTARVAARAFKRHLVLNEEALILVRDYFSRTGQPFPPRNEKQALLPQKATILPNLLGTAPGFLLHHSGKGVFFLPGVPTEMQAMLEHSVLPRLLEFAGAPSHPRQERIFKTFGLPEPRVEELLAAAALPSGIEVAFGVDFPFVHAKLRAGGDTADTLLDRAELSVRRALGEHLVATGKETLADNVARLLVGAGLTLALAESCTGGLIATMLTELPGASAFLDRGAVTYANTAKADWLGVPLAVLEGDGAVSKSCALAMAGGIRAAAGTDIGLAVTGIAGPTGGTPDKPVGTVWLALAAPGVEQAKVYRFSGDRGQI
ncbi:MAG: CinA family nicotinamide mononucleotide deamidase-related protein, partial [Desulfuromonadales bacterium]|nr:CinA family nicotinamide mononucleotide deamidase-related protein [Desulfuromonadales bacterium]